MEALHRVVDTVVGWIRSRLSGAVFGYVMAVVFVAATTVLLLMFRSSLEKAYIGLIYLLVVTVVAVSGGTRPALVAALLSFLSWNFFFLLPYYTLEISDPRDWLLLFAFLVIAVIVGQVAGDSRRRETEAIVREKEAVSLYQAALSVNTSPDVRLEGILQPLTEQILQSTNASGCAIIRVVGGQEPWIIAKSGDIDSITLETTRQIIQWVSKNAKSVGLCPPSVGSGQGTIQWPISVDYSQASPESESRSDVFIPLAVKESMLGVLYVDPGKDASFGPQVCRLLVTFAEIITTFLERHRLIEESARITAMRESENLRLVLFSSLSHNLKNPLVSLTMTLSSLLEKDVDWKPEAVREQHLMMLDDVKRLTENIENIINLAQLETGIWKPKADWYDLREILNAAIHHLPEKEIERVHMYLPDEMLLMWVDSVQMSQVARHLIENALFYSPPGSPVTIGAEVDNRNIRFWVDDKGPGVPPGEREEIFQKFYHVRAEAPTISAGTGLGLAICREIVQAHNGQISVENSPEGGARFIVTLPLKRSGEKG